MPCAIHFCPETQVTALSLSAAKNGGGVVGNIKQPFHLPALVLYSQSMGLIQCRNVSEDLEKKGGVGD